MRLYNNTYKLTKYEWLREGITYAHTTNYRVYQPVSKGGMFGNYIFKTEPYYLTLKEALDAIKRHGNAIKTKKEV